MRSNWPQLHRRVRQYWFKLAEDDVERIAGSREALVELVTERYGLRRHDAELEVDAWSLFLTFDGGSRSSARGAAEDPSM